MSKSFREYLNKSSLWEGAEAPSPKCKYCGNPVRPKATTCPSCGKAIKRENKVIRTAANKQNA